MLLKLTLKYIRINLFERRLYKLHKVCFIFNLKKTKENTYYLLK